MTEFAIVLMPEMPLKAKINSIKSFVGQNFGDQIFLTDPPHLTLFVGRTQRIDEVENMLQGIARQSKKIDLAVKDWLIFSNDIMTKQDTLVVTFKNNSLEPLQKLQSLLLEAVKPYRANLLPERYRGVQFKGDFKRNLDKFGFPFVGNVWIPHMSICSAEEKVIKKIICRINISSLRGSYKLGTIVLMTLKDDRPERLLPYKLK